MPISKIVSSKRARAALAAVLVSAGTIGGIVINMQTGNPAAVDLAVEKLIKPWEGLVLEAHWDPYARIWDICYGETRIDGKPVRPGMKFTQPQCEAMLKKRVNGDYYLPLTKRIKNFTSFPVSVQAAQISGAYNFGVGSAESRKGMAGSTAARLAELGQYRKACEAQTAWNKAGGRVVDGLVKRREMGDLQRIGEAELCVSGL